MLNRFSLAKKIAGGFSIVLVLLVMLAFVGRNGLTRVVDRVDTSNQFQALVNLILEARQHEKQFILTNDTKAVDVVQKDVASLKSGVQKIADTISDDQLEKDVQKIAKGLGAYGKAFDQYVDMAHQKDTLMADMNLKASSALEITSGIRDEQKAKYDSLMEESEAKIANMRMRVLFANRINENFLQAKGYRMVISDSQGENISMMSQWKGHHTDIKRDLKEVAPLMTEDISKQRHGKLVSAQDAVIEKANQFFSAKVELIGPVIVT